MEQIIEYLKALSEENRIRILLILEQAGELSVADIGNVLNIPQPKVSRHLARLRLAGWVKERRWRGFSLYRIELPHGNVYREFLINLASTHERHPEFAMDMQRLLGLRKKGTKPAQEQPQAENDSNIPDDLIS
ncbi:metalloregulator ArsR/SmtB family transcription factor [bacterium]|nr:metalloregulator ArsR/SmtB family transcription factor [bacterium]